MARINHGRRCHMAAATVISCAVQLFSGTTRAETYSYDSANRLSRILNGARDTRLFYDAHGNLVREFVRTGGSESCTDFARDESSDTPKIVQELGPGRNVKYAFLGDHVVAAQNAGSTSYSLEDVRNSVAALVSGAGAIQSARSYDAYGQVRATSGTMPSRASFNGEFAVEDTIFMRARSYAPSLGRFLQRDEVTGDAAEPGTFNRYAFVLNNPYGLVDPSGNWPLPIVTVGLPEIPIGRTAPPVVPPQFRKIKNIDEIDHGARQWMSENYGGRWANHISDSKVAPLLDRIDPNAGPIIGDLAQGIGIPSMVCADQALSASDWLNNYFKAHHIPWEATPYFNKSHAWVGLRQKGGPPGGPAQLWFDPWESPGDTPKYLLPPKTGRYPGFEYLPTSRDEWPSDVQRVRSRFDPKKNHFPLCKIGGKCKPKTNSR